MFFDPVFARRLANIGSKFPIFITSSSLFDDFFRP